MKSRASETPIPAGKAHGLGTGEESEMLLEALPQPAVTYDTQGFIRHFNQAAVTLFGREPLPGTDQWRGYLQAFTLSGESIGAQDSPMAAAMAAGTPLPGQQFIIQRPDGSRKTILESPRPLLNEKGEITGGLSLFYDPETGTSPDPGIREFYFNLPNFLPVAVYTCDRAGYITFFNRSAVDLWGRKPQIGKDLWCGSWKIYWTDGSPMSLSECPMAIALKEGREVNGEEIVIERPDGARRHVIPFPRPLLDGQGKVTGAVNMLLDVTNEKINEDKLSWMAAIVESSEDAIVSKTLQGIITSWNAAAERIFGFSADEMIGQSLLKLFPQDRQQEEYDILEKLKKGEKVDHFETKRVNKEGEVLDVSLTISPVKNSRGRIIGASKIARNITPQKRTERQAREAEEKFRLAVSATRLGFWELHPETSEVKWSDECRRIFLVPETMKINLPLFLQWVHPQDRELAKKEISKAIASPETGYFNIQFRIKRFGDGQTRWVKFQGKAYGNGSDKNESLIGTILDTTEETNAKEILEKTIAERTSKLSHINRELEKSNHELEQFAYSASHDLQEPLRKIQTFSEILKENIHDPNIFLKYFDKIGASAQRMSTLISDILNYSRLSQGEDHFTEVNLNHTLREVLGDFELVILEKGADIQTSELPVVRAIPLQMYQLFMNLINNSLKFCEGRPLIRIQAREMSDADLTQFPQLRPNCQYERIDFKDNGIGFDPKYADQVFRIFHRLHSSENYGGTGIGLAICKKIADNHLGIIFANSSPGKGTCFTVILPRTIPDSASPVQTVLPDERPLQDRVPASRNA